jgi:hypothetical protein
MLMSVIVATFDVILGFECCGEAGNFVVAERERAGGDVFGEMAARARAWDQQHVVGDREQPCQRDLRGCGIVTGGDLGDNRVGANRLVFASRPAERAKRNESDSVGAAFVEHGLRGPIREVVGVLDTDDVGDFKGPQQMLVGDVADPDSSDQALIVRGYQGTELVDESFVHRGVVEQAQIDRGQSFDVKRSEIVLDAYAELVGIVIGQEGADLVAPATDLADQCQAVRVGGERFPDKLVDHRGPVVMGRVDVIDTGSNGLPQHGDRFIVVIWRTEYSRAG